MSSMPAPWSSLLWFVFILALIPLALWALKRSPLGSGLGGASARQGGTPRPVAVLPLSAQHKLVTVEVGQGEERVWLVLGVSPQGLRTLHTMSPGTPVAADESTGTPAPAAAFHQLLTRMRKRGGNDVG
jgi:flagellar protein FliO/FliZ